MKDTAEHTILLWNARGLMTKNGRKLEELMLCAHTIQADMIVVTESHLDCQFTDNEISIPVYAIAGTR